MSKLLRTHLSTIVVAMVTAAVTAGAPAIAATIADYAANADKVDNKHAVGAGASIAARSNKLVATNAQGRLPDNIIAKAPNAAKINGLTSKDLWTKAETKKLRVKHFVAETVENRATQAVACWNHPGATLTVVAPGPGIVEVSGSVDLWAGHSNGFTSSLVVRVGNSATDCTDTAGSGRHYVHSTLPSGTYYSTVPVTRTFTVSQAGTYVYYLNGNGSTNTSIWRARLNATFFPGAK